MSIIEKLRKQVAENNVQALEEVSQPMLNRIAERVSGGAGGVWCKASWGSGCDKVNVNVASTL